VRIAVIADVHANQPALTAAFAVIDRLGVDSIYHVGDAIGIGPFPRECLDLLLSREKLRFIMGNHDEWFAFGLPIANAMSPGERNHQLWTHAQLDARSRAIVASWPYTDLLEHLHHVIGFVHYPRDLEGRFLLPQRTPIHQTPVADLFPTPPTLVFYGHDHQVLDTVVDGVRLINPGSLGCSATPEARFILLEVGDDGGMEITSHAVPYESDALLRAFVERDVPEREFIRRIFVLPGFGAAA